MTIKQVMETLDAELLTPEADLTREVHAACGSDMMSDVLAYVKDQAVLVTGLNNPQVVRTADMMDMICIVFVRGKKPDGAILQLAVDRGIAVLATKLPMFAACGLLYEKGLRGGDGVMDAIRLHYTVPGDDFTRAGEASADLKARLKKLGIPADAVRKVAIALYEGEINLAIHAGGGEIDVAVTDERVDMTLTDQGPGIPDIALAMSEGWSTAPDEVRSLGFGAGMGLPNMKKYSDEFDIQSTVGVGTTVKMLVNID